MSIARLAAGLALLSACAFADVTLPPAERLVLDNGTVIVVNEKREVPLVGIDVLIRGGAVRDPVGKEGLAALTASLLERGAGERDAPAFAAAVEAVGGRLSVSADLEYLRVRGEFLSRDLELALELIGDLIIAPRLEPGEFDKLKARQIDLVRAAKDRDPGALLPVYAAGFLFGEHPYGNPGTGSEASLAALEHDEVMAFYADEIGADRLVVAVSGDVAAAALGERLSAIFGGFRKSAGPIEALPSAPAVAGSRVLLIDKPGATQTYFWIGGPGVAIDYPQRHALDIANTVFGGRFTSMLNTALRVESGLSYGARSTLIRPFAPGSVGIQSFTRTDATVEAIDMALAVLERFRIDGMDAPTLASAQNYLRGRFPNDFETAAQLAASFATLELYGLERRFVDDYLAGIDAVTVENLGPVIDAVYPAGDRLVFVILGDADAIRESLAKYGEATELSLTDPVFRAGRR